MRDRDIIVRSVLKLMYQYLKLNVSRYSMSLKAKEEEDNNNMLV